MQLPAICAMEICIIAPMKKLFTTEKMSEHLPEITIIQFQHYHLTTTQFLTVCSKKQLRWENSSQVPLITDMLIYFSLTG